MPDSEGTVEVLREWLHKAENDLKTAAHTLTLGKECPTDTVCFHVQQCVEKYLKALLVLRCIPLPKTHNLPMVMELVPEELRPDLSEDLQDLLTSYAVMIRYPGVEMDIPLPEARKAVAIARRVRKEIRKHLPKAALRRRRE